MASAVIGALRVNLSADTAAFEKGLANASARLGALSKTARAVGAAIATGLGAALVGLSAAMKGSINQMDAFAKLSQKIGVPVEQLTALAHAADLSGVSLDGLATGFRKLSQNMADASIGTGGAREAFDNLSISVTNADGTLRSSTDIMAEIADKFASIEDGAAKTALAVDLFGRSGADLIPLLNAGATGLRGMLEEAEALGLTFSTSAAKAAEQFNDNLTRLSAVWSGIVTQLTADVVPILARVTDGLVNAAKNSGLVQTVSGALSGAFEGLARAVKLLYDNVGVLINVMVAFLALKVAGFVVNMGIAFVNLVKTVRAAGLAMAAFNVVQNISRAGILLLAGGLLFATGQLENFKAAMSDLGQVVQGALPEDFTGTLKSALEELGLDASALEEGLFGFSESTESAAAAQTKLNLALTNTAAPARDAKAALAEKQSLIEQVATPLEQYQAQLERLSELEKQVGVDAQTSARVQLMAAATLANQWGQVAATVGQALGTLFEDNKTVAIATALINTFQGITQALANYPPPFSFAMAAAQAALGFAQVAKIRQTSRTSKGGGSAMGAGASGRNATDAAFGANSGSTPAPDRALFLTVQGEVFGREHIRNLAEQLIEFQRDGGRVVLAQ